ncbi:amidohydrolase family protein [Nitrolancea hollandica]|uniref:Putative amidohydrolase 2 n=1 Tax=Nitrolancea hollandica Lb TaxID=1129897 RepID=I4EK56_9BACT|nr:amidohydrolase family protein [Nitrolancea hollandica]CCF85068.1 putative amidohydrolase 2 [Nitrolancea hollandica Lb]
MASIDLSGIPIIDNHCHGLYRDQGPFDPAAWRRFFTESRDPDMPRDHVPNTIVYRRMLRDLAGFFGCEPPEEAVLAARRKRDPSELTGALLQAAHIDTLLIDGGYPPPERVLPNAELAQISGCRVLPVLRLETLMERLIAEHDTLAEVREALGAALSDLRGQGYVALKSIAAYRTGLDIRKWPDEDAERAFAAARREVLEQGSSRLAHKPLLDTLLHVAFIEAARQEIPVQFHVGYGDSDADLLLGNPLLLRPVLEDPAYRGLPVILLHACYPYTREGGYLASIYEQVSLDLSYGIPFLGYREMLAFTRIALGIAPVSKLLYSSDGVGVPELHWSGALNGHRVLGAALAELVEQGELSGPEAEAVGAAILAGNARRLYRL